MKSKWPAVLRILIENKANGPAIISTLRQKVGGIVAIEPRGSKESRANAISAVVESGDVYLPHPSLFPWVGNTGNREQDKESFVEEAASFPFGRNDDQVDAMSQALLDFELKGNTSPTRSSSYAGVTASNGLNGHNSHAGRTSVSNGLWGDDD